MRTLLRLTQKMLWLACTVLLLGALTTQAQAASTTLDTKFRLQVEPVDCTVDFVQNGSGQTLQIPAHSCLPIVPALLTPVSDGNSSSPLLPLLDEVPALPIIILQPVAANSPWSPVASTSAGQSFRSSSVGVVPAMIAGIGTVAAVTAIGVDAALFELSHSKSAARWARSRLKLS